MHHMSLDKLLQYLGTCFRYRVVNVTRTGVVSGCVNTIDIICGNPGGLARHTLWSETIGSTRSEGLRPHI